eukprot:927081-Amphidinium_carterae.1
MVSRFLGLEFQKATKVVRDALELVELTVDAKESLEPEDDECEQPAPYNRVFLTEQILKRASILLGTR